jgi:hypothetical protein
MSVRLDYLQALDSASDRAEAMAIEAGAESARHVHIVHYFSDPLGATMATCEDGRITAIAIAGIVDGRDYGDGRIVHIVDARQALSDAVEEEHPSCLCGDDACDITEANKEAGAPLWAARLLSGATEAPLLDAVWWALARNDEAPTESGIDGDCDVFLEHMRLFGVRCDACGAYTFGDGNWRPESCGNCCANLPTEEEEESRDDE